MIKQKQGFTIVELLIVIIIIGILATITITTYSGIQTRAENTKTSAAAKQATKLLSAYKVINGDYPTYAGGTQACIGIGYTNDICSQDADGSNAVTVSTSLNAKLSTLGNIPQPSTKILTRDNGRQVTGMNFQYSNGMIRYYLSGASTPCSGGGTGYNYADVTECRITLP